MRAIDRAIKTRWTAKGLDSVITGGIWHSQIPEGTAFPYCSFSHVSDAPFSQSHGTRVSEQQVQFQVYDTTKEAVEDEMEAIKAAFQSADRAGANPLSIAASAGGILNCRIAANYTILQESDGVWSGTMAVSILYAEEAGLTPA